MRELSAVELDLVSGGWGEDPSELDEVIVNGRRAVNYTNGYIYIPYPGSGTYNPGGPATGGSGGYGGSEGSYADESKIDIEFDYTQNLTAEQKATFEEFKAAIGEMTARINALPDGIQIGMPDGSVITSETLKSMWSKTDFSVIVSSSNDPFGNGGISLANYNNGNPLVTVNLNGLINYAAWDAIPYFLAHELAHTTPAGYDHLSTGASNNEQWAGSLASAIVQVTGISLNGFTPPEGTLSSPYTITYPGSGGGGGGGGGSGDTPWYIE